MIYIREANKGDAETLCAVLCASIRELCSADHKDDPETITRWTANKTPEHVARWIADPQRKLFLAARDDQPAGVGCISGDGEVLLNYVAPAHRFCGVSRALLAHIETVLVENGVTTARLTSTETAHRFYRDAGWTDVGEPEILFGLKGYPMKKGLRVRRDSSRK